MNKQIKFKKKLQYVLTRTFIVLAMFSFINYRAAKVYAVYYPAENITNPTCAPSEATCYVSLLPDQTGNSGMFLTTNGTITSWTTIGSSVDASVLVSGLVNTTTQSFAGVKTFTSAPTFSSLTTNGGILYTNGSGAVTQSGALTGLVLGNGTSAPTALTTSAGLISAISDETGTGALVFGTSPTITTPTFTTSATSPLLIGGTGTTSPLTLRSTSGVGATGADIIFQTGNNGGTEAMRILNNGNVGIGTSSPSSALDVNGQLTLSSGTLSLPALRFANSTTSGISYSSSNNGALELSLNGVLVGHFGYSYASGGASINGQGNLMMGYGAGKNITDAYATTIFGQTSGEELTTGIQNTFIGSRSGVKTTSGGQNVFVGQGAGFQNTVSSRHVYVGYHGGLNNVPADGVLGNVIVGTQAGEGIVGSSTFYGNVLIGDSAGRIATTAHNVILIGSNAGAAHSSAIRNIAIGSNALGATTTGSDTVAIGYAAGGASIATGSTGNVFLGFSAGGGVIGLSTGTENVFIGQNSGLVYTTATENTATGRNSLQALTTGNNNVATGSAAGFNNTTGTSNVFIGWRSGYTATPANATTTGSNNTFIGTQAGQGSTTQLTNATAIGYQALVTASNALVLGNSSVSVGIGTTAPSYKLHVGDGTTAGIIARFQNSTGTCDINPTTTSLSCSSDRTLKTNITNLNNTILNQITTLQPVTYNWISDTQGLTQTGFIAQDVEAIFPNLVSTDPKTNLKSLNYIGLIPYVVEGIKELSLKLSDVASLDLTKSNSVASLVKSFLADSANQIGDLYARVIHTENVHTKNLCIDDVCINKDQLINIINSSNAGQNIIVPATIVTPPDQAVTPPPVEAPIVAPAPSDPIPPVVAPVTEPAVPPVSDLVVN
jgi:hypothetical protein